MIKILTTGFIHWFLQRISAISLLLFLFLLFVYKNVVIATILLIIISFHFKIGFETLISDYMHDLYFKIFGETTLRLIIIYIIKFLFLVTLI